MRLLVPSLALTLLVGCFDCNFPDYGSERSFLDARAATGPVDTLVVRVEVERSVAEIVSVYVPAGGVRLVTQAQPDAHVFGRATVRGYEPIRAVRLDAAAAGDTLVVAVTRESVAALPRPVCGDADGLVRPVCSPAPSEVEVHIESVSAPEGTRAVVVEYNDPRLGLSRAAYARPARG
ncbi:hypothetical protein [Rubrivirga sp.]|uniref:hypothetical protein n=1 Tax=Rubrivirga sp. TaxID=1885344 RepID=UPI003B51B39F